MSNSFTLGEIVEVELAGYWIKGKIIYLEGVGSISADFTWMEEVSLKGMCIQWLDKDFAFSLLSINADKSDLADFIQVEDNFDEEIRKTKPQQEL